ncbi:hypothetical protein CDL15_Pgr008323 [Punica granatum]|uniref:Uncharacterized protein n=1 Tax=Punica granatum TaxID=22663 RepID=A0A218XS69_PUNGR|nr:hypothetical protein CDL15_Pgr008323 [Punica granatum]PKI77702.1 hypothetical protein CRG98_001932 [Punica granatum]
MDPFDEQDYMRPGLDPHGEPGIMARLAKMRGRWTDPLTPIFTFLLATRLETIVSFQFTVSKRSLLAHEDPTEPLQTKTDTPAKTSSSSGTATMVDLTKGRIDHLRWQAAEKDEELTDEPRPQRELAQTRAKLERRDQEFV